MRRSRRACGCGRSATSSTRCRPTSPPTRTSPASAPRSTERWRSDDSLGGVAGGGGWRAAEAAAREAAGLQRSLHPRAAEGATTDLAGNDYLGLSRDPAVVEASAAAARRWGAGAGASRLVTGSLELHAQLERELAAYLGQPAALVFSTGYHANLAVVAALGGRDALVVSDAHVHASLVDAVRLSKAAVEVVPHHDVSAVEH